jgi:hypothetical protein
MCISFATLVAADPPEVTKKVDLAQPLRGDWAVPDGAKITLQLIHKVPHCNYDIQLQKYTLNPSALDAASLFKAPPPAASSGGLKGALPPSGVCSDLHRAVDAMFTGTERDVEAHLVGLKRALGATGADACADADVAATLEEETKQTIDISELFPSIAPDEGIVVSVSRIDCDNPPDQPWSLDVHPGVGTGKFLSNYVFGFAPNRDKRYFAKADGSVFKIAPQARRDNGTMVPLVLFSWLPRSRALGAWVPSWTAGLGFDLSNPVVAVGGLWTWNRNLGVSVGVLGQKQQRLKGKYQVGQEVAANLESTDLTESTWAPNVYVGISIRSVTALFK